MKSALFAVAGLACVAGAQVYPQVRMLQPGEYTAEYSVIDDGSTVNPEFTGMSYDALAFVAPVTEHNITAGQTITEDYVSIQTDTDYLNIHRFVGGVAVANEVIEFLFYNAGGNFVDGYGVTLPSAGLTFVWTITISSDVFVPKDGYLVMRAGATNTGVANWRRKVAAPAIGTTTGDVYRWNMEVNDIPAPASLALMGVAGLISGRRRRA
ncbi:MAG: hypothetical protein IT439_03150 [Phycisphaerales bacterium]|nr:hypothetical protein [Phycisphaerales bacterium]